MPTPMLSRQDLMKAKPPAPDFRWRVVMPQVSNTAFSTSGNVINNNQILVEAVNWPWIHIPARARHGGGSNWYYPDFNDSGTVSITFYEDEEYSVLKYLQLWSTLIVDNTGAYGPPSGPNGFRKEISVYMFNWEDSYSPVMKDMALCWPTQVDPFNLNYNSEGRLTVACQFSCQKSYFDLSVR